MQKIKMTEEQYEEYRDDSCGICLECGDVTYGGVEPDAECYECEDCGEEKVYGIEEALLMGEIEIVDEQDLEHGYEL